MANPKEKNDPASAAIQDALRIKEKQPALDAQAKNRTHDEVAEVLKKLARVSEQGAKNKLPGATSDHSFLYQDGAPT